MEPTSGIDAASQILQDYPEAKILFLIIKTLVRFIG